jgi:hypothetical protein
MTYVPMGVTVVLCIAARGKNLGVSDFVTTSSKKGHFLTGFWRVLEGFLRGLGRSEPFWRFMLNQTLFSSSFSLLVPLPGLSRPSGRPRKVVVLSASLLENGEVRSSRTLI